MQPFIQVFFYSTAGKRTVPWNVIGGVTLIGHGSYENFFFCACDNCVWLLNFQFWSNNEDTLTLGQD